MPKLPDNRDWFGRKPPENANIVAAWGARAILTGRRSDQWIDIVSDRKQLWLPEGAEGRAFITWLEGPFHTWLLNRCGQPWIDPMGSEVYRLEDPPFCAEACTNRSAGYLYIGAWQAQPV